LSIQIHNQTITLGSSITGKHKALLADYRATGFDTVELILNGIMATRTDAFDQMVRYCSEMTNAVQKAGLQLYSIHLPFGMYWNQSSPDRHIRKVVSQVC